MNKYQQGEIYKINYNTGNQILETEVIILSPNSYNEKMKAPIVIPIVKLKLENNGFFVDLTKAKINGYAKADVLKKINISDYHPEKSGKVPEEYMQIILAKTKTLFE